MNVRDHLNGRLVPRRSTNPFAMVQPRACQRSLKRPQYQFIPLLVHEVKPTQCQSNASLSTAAAFAKFAMRLGSFPSSDFQRLESASYRCFRDASGANASVSAMRQRYRTKRGRNVMPTPRLCRRASSIPIASVHFHMRTTSPRWSSHHPRGQCQSRSPVPAIQTGTNPGQPRPDQPGSYPVMLLWWRRR